MFTEPLRRRPVWRAAALVGLFTALTLVMAYPLSLEPGERALDLGADTRLFLWTIAWDVHALGTRPWAIFDANIFYPEPNTLAYSENLIGSALLGAPWLAMSHNPLLALNVVALLSCLGCGLGAYFLSRKLGLGRGGALVAGVVFAFAPPRFFRLGQIHLATVQWMPFCLGFIHAYASGGSRRHLVGAVLLFTLQALSGGQSGLYLLLVSMGLVVYLAANGAFRPRGSLVKDFAVAALVGTVLNVPFLIPYIEVRRDVGLSRSLEEAESWSPNAVSFIAAPTHVQRALLSIDPGLERKVLARARGYLFPGFLTLVLAGLAFRRRHASETAGPPPNRSPPPGALATWLDGLIVVWGAVLLLIQASGGIRWEILGVTISARSPGRAAAGLVLLLAIRLALLRRTPFAWAPHLNRLRQASRRWLGVRMGGPAGFYVLVAVLSFWACLGPRFGLYTALYNLLPGFDFVRVPARLSILTVLGLAVLAGVGFDNLLRRRSWFAHRALGASVLLAMLAEFAAFPLDAPPYPLSVPSVEKWLAERPAKVALVELPVPDPRDGVASARYHSLYMVYSTTHWHDLVNGYSGFTPARHDLLFRMLVDFPNEASLESLESLGVTFAVLHRKLYRADDWERVTKKLEEFSDRLRLELEEEDSRVYRLTRSKNR